MLNFEELIAMVAVLLTYNTLFPIFVSIIGYLIEKRR